MAMAGAAAVGMLDVNALTINPFSVSAVVLAAVWLAFGAAVGYATGYLGGRTAVILRRPFVDGALAMSVLTVAHLLLPAGAGVLLALPVLVARQIRLRLVPRAARVDLALAIGAAALFTLFYAPHTSPPPSADASVALAEASPVPGSVPVTISVHTRPGYPPFPAVHLPVRALAAGEAGRRSALWTGRLPERTRAGRGRPRLLPGGGGIARGPDALGTAWLSACFPAPASLAGTPFEPSGTLAAQARAAGIPVLTGPPADDDPPFFLRILEDESPPDAETAAVLRENGAWIDVTLAPDGGGKVALAGDAFLLARASGLVNLVDVTPTALHLLGLPVPRTCDGRVLLEVMRDPGPGGRALRYRELVASAAPDDDVSPITTSR